MRYVFPQTGVVVRETNEGGEKKIFVPAHTFAPVSFCQEVSAGIFGKDKIGAACMPAFMFTKTRRAKIFFYDLDSKLKSATPRIMRGEDVTLL